MGFLSKLYPHKENENAQKGGGMEDFMTLIRVYYQAAIACKVGITNLNALPDLRVFKQTLHVATVNNKLGQGEKQRCRKMLNEIYGMEDNFFKEIDESIKRNCKQIQDVQTYMYVFQGFSQDLMMVVSNTMQWKLRIPSIFKKTLYDVVEKGVNNILTKDNWKDDAVRKGVIGIRHYQKRLGYSQNWMTQYVYHIILLAKKEPRPKDSDEKKPSN
ncbi:MAG: hypothetical protein SPK32_07090 [Bacteroidaceae bacterium]|nr:hypothetical protein [Bacteroidaceae bacterium]